MSEALIPPTYGGILELRKHFRLLYGTVALDYLLATPAPTAAQLTAWLETPANLDAFRRLLATNAGASAVCASSTAMAAIAGSNKALETLRDSSTGCAAMVNSKTAMDAVLAAGAGAISSVLAISAVRTAVYDSETGWAALVASATGKAALAALMRENTTTSTVHTYPPGVGASTRAVLVSQKSNITAKLSYAGAFADTYTTMDMNFIDRYVRISGLSHRTSTSGSGTIRYVVMQ